MLKFIHFLISVMIFILYLHSKNKGKKLLKNINDIYNFDLSY